MYFGESPLKRVCGVRIICVNIIFRSKFRFSICKDFFFLFNKVCKVLSEGTKKKK